jgi:hypothetical protein
MLHVPSDTKKRKKTILDFIFIHPTITIVVVSVNKLSKNVSNFLFPGLRIIGRAPVDVLWSLYVSKDVDVSERDDS